MRKITSPPGRTFSPEELLPTPALHTLLLQTHLISAHQDLLYSWGPSCPQLTTQLSAKPRVRQQLLCEGRHSAKIKEQAALSDTLLIKLLQADSIINELPVPCR